MNQKGFSLIEIMIVAAGLAGLALVVVNLTEQTNKSQVTAEGNFEKLDFRRKLSNLLAQKSTCDLNFINHKMGTPITKIKNSTGLAVIEVGKVYANNTLKVKSMTSQLVKNNTDGSFDMDLILDFDKTKAMALGKTARIRFPLTVEAPSAGAPITNCQTNDGLWALDKSNIYNTNSKNVGIGTATPGAKLDVAGSIRPGSQSEVTACGMGKAHGEGGQRYNYTTHVYEYCNGSGWVPMGGGGTGRFGGTYATYTFKSFSCKTVNPVTGTCGCPPGHIGTLSGQVYRDKPWDETWYSCYKP